MVNPDQKLAWALADELNRQKPHTTWEFTPILDICNCANCKSIIIQVRLDTHGNPLDKVIGKSLFLEEVQCYQDNLPKLAQNLLEPLKELAEN